MASAPGQSRRVAELAAKLARLGELHAAIRERAGASSPVAFARIAGQPERQPDGSLRPFEPDAWQARVLTTTSPRVLLNCCRQSGKSTTAALLVLHRAMHTAGIDVLLISPSLRQSGELYRKVRASLRRWAPTMALTHETSTSLELPNGSRVISLPAREDTIRTFAPALIVEDEAGDVSDEVFVALWPMLAATHGQLIVMGTPKGQRGHFWEAWEKHRSLWGTVRVQAKDVPRFTSAQLDEARIVLGSLYAQEYECAFLTGGAGRVYEGFREELSVIDKLPSPGKWTKLLALDFGIVDQNGIALLAWREHDPCLYVEFAYRFSGDAVALAEEVVPIYDEHRPERVIGDIGGMGKAFAAQLSMRHRLPVSAAQKHDKLGSISLLNGEMRRGRIKVVRGACSDLVGEWNTLPWGADRLFGRKEAEGFANHCADAVLYGWRAARAHLEQPAPVKPATPVDAWALEEAAMLAREEREGRRGKLTRTAPRGAWKDTHLPATSWSNLRRR